MQKQKKRTRVSLCLTCPSDHDASCIVSGQQIIVSKSSSANSSSANSSSANHTAQTPARPLATATAGVPIHRVIKRPRPVSEIQNHDETATQKPI